MTWFLRGQGKRVYWIPHGYPDNRKAAIGTAKRLFTMGEGAIRYTEEVQRVVLWRDREEGVNSNHMATASQRAR